MWWVLDVMRIRLQICCVSWQNLINKVLINSSSGEKQQYFWDIIADHCNTKYIFLVKFEDSITQEINTFSSVP